MQPFDKARVAEVVVRHGDRTEYGSGYRISSSLVLTVAHLLGPLDEAPACTVLLGGDDTEHPVTPVWRSTGRDLALLRLGFATEAGTDTGEGPSVVSPLALGRLPDGTGSVPFTGIGFPAYAQRAGSDRVRGLRRRDSRQVGGSVHLGSNMKSGYLDLSFTTAPPEGRGPGGQDPWQGISGTALFTQDGTLLIGVQSQRLPAAGTGSAEAEPITVALEDPQFVSLLALDGVPPQAVAVELPGGDRGESLPSVVPQKELVAGFGDFKKNLTSEHLPFVSPGSDHRADPQNLFISLVTSADRGVLLVGAAGTGKTRTGLEVGRLALRAGWRVLHVLPGEHQALSEQLAKHVLAEPGPVLVVIDYLNESQLDLPALRHRLIPAAHRQGIPIALLASVRPGWLQKADRALLHELFDEVELRQDDDFRRQVTGNALTRLAPRALHEFGEDRMMAICGNRPIVALLVAREIERRVESGLSVPLVAGLRSSGELPGWLERRLNEDGLTVPGRKDTFTPAHASYGLVAAAAAAAACPQPRAQVVSAARAALARMAGDAPDTEVPDAEDIVTTLVSLGWLEPENDMLSVAHDLVADQLIESVVLPERNGAPDEGRTRALLAGCLTGPRTIGRYAANVGRLVNDLSLADRADQVAPVFDAWFMDNAAAVGRVMRQDADVGSYALGAVCSGPPWYTAAVQCWEEIVGPWLTEFGVGVNARHLLYRGLRHLPSDGALLLVPTALDWLRTHIRRRDASYVLSSLLHRTDLPPEALERTVDSTLRWLERHSTLADADFVLRPLLSRDDLRPDDVRHVVASRLTWLGEHAANPEGGFALRSLLSRDDLGPDEVRQVVSAALIWLGDHAVSAEAGFVLRSLLFRDDLGAVEAKEAVSAALIWLRDHAVSAEAGFVLSSLLSHRDLQPVEAGRAVSSALIWLGQHAGSDDADFVLRSLLSRDDLQPVEAGRAVSSALIWLGDHATRADADFVLRSLLSRDDLQPVEAGRAVSAALTWLGEHARGAEAGFVLTPLLSREGLQPVEAGEAVSSALIWLGDHAVSAEAGFVLRSLLSHRGLQPVEAGRAVSAALVWLGDHAVSAEAGFVLRSLLFRDDLGAVEAGRAVSAALIWLGQHAGSDDADFVLSSLLSREGLQPVEAGRAVSAALIWLGDHAMRAEARFVLDRLLSRRDLQPVEAGQAVSAALIWLGEHARGAEAGFVLAPLLAQRGLGAVEVRQGVSAALMWLGIHASVAEAGFVLAPLLARRDLQPAEVRQGVSAALIWLGDHAVSAEARFVLDRLLSRRDLQPVEAGQGVSAALMWLEDRASVAEAGFVLAPLLAQRGLKPVEVRQAVSAALMWLGDHATVAEARFVLRSLLSRGGLKPVEAGQGVSAALMWLGDHATVAEAGFVLDRLLSRRDLQPVEAGQAVSAALIWLRGRTSVAEARFVLSSLLSREGLGPVEAGQVVSAALMWLGEHARGAEAA
ncbi:trypsin-like peptidase domain-containing protein, partial [Streptomyces rubiginosohelvolus]|uniref:trypsin-like peptidase domain-containing protein n=1 Tax=Streptomyces rubiginosohelvolus TaxID=67362 RepID=UPI0036815B08